MYLILTTFFLFFSEKQFSFTEKQRFDGWFNNLAHPQWGSIGMSKLIFYSIIYYYYIVDRKDSTNARGLSKFHSPLFSRTIIVL